MFNIKTNFECQTFYFVCKIQVPNYFLKLFERNLQVKPSSREAFVHLKRMKVQALL